MNELVAFEVVVIVYAAIGWITSTFIISKLSNSPGGLELKSAVTGGLLWPFVVVALLLAGIIKVWVWFERKVGR